MHKDIVGAVLVEKGSRDIASGDVTFFMRKNSALK
jgi:hypothetical protein